jgi:outer membrane protein assembly factor BamB
MQATTRFALIAAAIAAVVLVHGAPCRADLFAVGTSQAEIYRIDSNSGTVVDTYAVPDGLPGLTARSGLAFDGRILYLSTGNFSVDSVAIHRFDVLNETWLDSTPIIHFDPFGDESLGGLGFKRFPDRTALVATMSNPTSPGFPFTPLKEIPLDDSVPTGQLVRFGTTEAYDPSWPDIYVPGDSGLGLDVDPATGEIWLTTHDSPTNTSSLYRIDPPGVPWPVNTLLSLNARATGLGFDQGRLFVADATRTIYELDRNTGSVLNSFTLEGPGLIGALTGGPVAPEPGSVSMLLIAVLTLCGSRRR